HATKQGLFSVNSTWPEVVDLRILFSYSWSNRMAIFHFGCFGKTVAAAPPWNGSHKTCLAGKRWSTAAPTERWRSRLIVPGPASRISRSLSSRNQDSQLFTETTVGF